MTPGLAENSPRHAFSSNDCSKKQGQKRDFRSSMLTQTRQPIDDCRSSVYLVAGVSGCSRY